MFPNLNAEMARRNMTVRSLSERTNIPYSTLAPKLRGEKPLKYKEAENIKMAIGTDLELEELFKEEA